MKNLWKNGFNDLFIIVVLRPFFSLQKLEQHCLNYFPSFSSTPNTLSQTFTGRIGRRGTSQRQLAPPLSVDLYGTVAWDAEEAQNRAVIGKEMASI